MCPNFLKLIPSYLRIRSITMDFVPISVSTLAVPQGPNLGPSLFLVDINDVLDMFFLYQLC